MTKKLKIFVEDYNTPLSPWYILNEKAFPEGVKELSNGQLSFTSLFFFKKDFALWGAREDEFNAATDFFVKKILNEPEFLEKVIKNHYKIFEDIKKFGAFVMSMDLAQKNGEELFEIYESHYKLFAECWKWALVIQFTDMGEIKFSDVVKNELKGKLFRFGNSEIIFNTLITPKKETEVSKEGQSVLELLVFIRKNKKFIDSFEKAENISDLEDSLVKKLQELAEKYGYLQYYFIGPAAKPEYYFDLIKRKLNDDSKKEIKNREADREQIRKTQEEVGGILSENELLKVSILKEFMYLKEARKELQMYYLNYVMENWYKEIGRRFFWSPLRARYIIREEYKKILVGNKNLITEKDLNNRYNLCAYFLEGGVSKLYVGEEAKKMEEMFIKEEGSLENIQEIKGSVAYHGKISGSVKIVNSTNDLKKFNEGDILVSFSTNPSFVPAMNKAGAIVTNTGGITCHAAIVSRELKIPCIIGTKIATKVLKDGDLVEVDADKGVVRIIN